MEYQQPAQGIMLTKEFKDAKFYKVSCNCGCQSDVDLFLEVDDFAITLGVNAQTKTAYWRRVIDVSYTENWFAYALKCAVNRWVNTARICWTAITQGYVETESYTILSRQQAYNLAETLKQGIEEYDARVDSRKQHND